VDEVPPGAVVVFSAHGIAPEVRRDAERRELRAIDATCPLVTKVHNEARRFAAKDYDILLVGHEGHEEVVGTAGEAPSRVRLVDGADGAAQVEVRDPSKVVWLSQTTLSVDETVETVHALRERFPALLDPPSDDICYATQNRQAAVKAIAGQADLVIVVGSPNSSNSVRLVEVARDYGAPAAHPPGPPGPPGRGPASPADQPTPPTAPGSPGMVSYWCEITVGVRGLAVGEPERRRANAGTGEHDPACSPVAAG
jgi:4-hydroxy-3-methylbut-2-enyl diphosphate reductase